MELQHPGASTTNSEVEWEKKETPTKNSTAEKKSNQSVTRPVGKILTKDQKVTEYLKDEKKGTVSNAPLLSRPYDLFIIGFYLVFCLSTAIIDYHNVLAPAMGLTIRQLQHAKKPFNWPSQFLTDQVFMPWGENIDPIMIENPLFWQVMEWINVLFLSPVNLVMAFAFIFGYAKSFRTLGIIHATSLLYSMILCLATGLVDSTNPLQFTICYSLYATYPIAIIVRLWDEKPFTRATVNGKGFIQKVFQFFLALHLIFFILFCYHWLVMHTPFMKGLPDWYPFVDTHIISKIPLLAKEPYATWLKQFNAKCFIPAMLQQQ